MPPDELLVLLPTRIVHEPATAMPGPTRRPVVAVRVGVALQLVAGVLDLLFRRRDVSRSPRSDVEPGPLLEWNSHSSVIQTEKSVSGSVIVNAVVSEPRLLLGHTCHDAVIDPILRSILLEIGQKFGQGEYVLGLVSQRAW